MIPIYSATVLYDSNPYQNKFLFQYIDHFSVLFPQDTHKMVYNQLNKMVVAHSCHKLTDREFHIPCTLCLQHIQQLMTTGNMSWHTQPANETAFNNCGINNTCMLVYGTANHCHTVVLYDFVTNCLALLHNSV